MYESTNNHDDFCVSSINTLSKCGLNCPVELAVIDSASGSSNPLYISVNGNKSFDNLEKYMEDNGYVWYN